MEPDDRDNETPDRDFLTEEVPLPPPPLPEGEVPSFTLYLEHNMTLNPVTQLMDYTGTQPRLKIIIHRNWDDFPVATLNVPGDYTVSLRGDRIYKFFDEHPELFPLEVSQEDKDLLEVHTKFTFPVPVPVEVREAS